jgi:predicted PurR-regulated permease PerM
LPLHNLVLLKNSENFILPCWLKVEIFRSFSENLYVIILAQAWLYIRSPSCENDLQKANIMRNAVYFPQAARFLITTAAFMITIAGLRAAETLVVPFLLAIFIAIISVPPLFWIQQRGFSMLSAMLIIVAAATIFGSSILLLVGTSLDDFAKNLPSYQMRLEQSLSSSVKWLNDWGVTLSTDVVLKYLDPQAVMGLAGQMVSAMGGILAHSFLVLLIVIFILLEAYSFPTKLRAIWGDAAQFQHLHSILNNIQRYIAIKTSMSLITGITVTVMLMIFKIDYPILWGIFAFLLNYVPNIGSLLAAIPAVLLAIIQLDIITAAYVATGYVAINAIVGNIIEPRLMGQGLGLSTLVVFLSLVFWGWVLGPIGMLLSVPLTMTVKIALEYHEDTRWIAILLSSEVAAIKAHEAAPLGSEVTTKAREGAE